MEKNTMIQKLNIYDFFLYKLWHVWEVGGLFPVIVLSACFWTRFWYVFICYIRAINTEAKAVLGFGFCLFYLNG